MLKKYKTRRPLTNEHSLTATLLAGDRKKKRIQEGRLVIVDHKPTGYSMFFSRAYFTKDYATGEVYKAELTMSLFVCRIATVM